MDRAQTGQGRAGQIKLLLEFSMGIRVVGGAAEGRGWGRRGGGKVDTVVGTVHR